MFSWLLCAVVVHHNNDDNIRCLSRLDFYLCMYGSMYGSRQIVARVSQSCLEMEEAGKNTKSMRGECKYVPHAKKSDETATTMCNTVGHACMCTVTHKAHLLHSNSSLTRQSLNSIDRRGRTLCVCDQPQHYPCLVYIHIICMYRWKNALDGSNVFSLCHYHVRSTRRRHAALFVIT